MGFREDIKRYPQHIIYRTRPNDDGDTSTVSVGTAWFLVWLLLIQVAVMGWTIIAVVEAVMHVVGWF